IHTINGSALEDKYGVSVAGLGDVDGDGVGDFVVGASRAFSQPQPVYPPRVDVRSGATGALLYALIGFTGSEFGTSVANAGDIDGDGIADVVVRSEEHTSELQSRR